MDYEDEEPSNRPLETNSTWKLCTIAAVLAATACLVLGLSVGLGLPQGSGNDEIDRYDRVVKFFVENGVSSYEDLTTPETPQYLAARWISDEDDAQVPLPENNYSIHNELDSTVYRYVARYVLAVNYFSLRGKGWWVQLNFLSPSDICNWNGIKLAYHPSATITETGGVICDRRTGLPTKLDLEFQRLNGTIASEIGLLTSLQVIDLKYNPRLSGTLPTTLCHLTSLKEFSVTRCNLRGSIPSCIGSWSKVEIIGLAENSFSGTLPPAQLPHLSLFYLFDNRLSGEIPSTIGTWRSLHSFLASRNSLSGTIPSNITTLRSIRRFWVDHNNLAGDPIATISNMTSLEYLYLAENRFSGMIDVSFAKNLNSLIELDFSSNNFTSDGIPQNLFTLPFLEVLDLGKNNLRGSLPTNIPKNMKLEILALYDNKLNGLTGHALANLTSLRHLDLSANMFAGIRVPDELFSMTSIENLFLAENQFEDGTIPTTLSSMTQLRELSLKNTSRVGALPDLNGFDLLVLLDLDNNDLTGSIPASYGNLTATRYLLLNRNKALGGTIPQFHSRSRLNVFVLDGTNITGDFSTVCALQTLMNATKETMSQDTMVVAPFCTKDKVKCTCCYCCKGDEDTNGPVSCTNPQVANLDYRWGYFGRHIRGNRNLGIDLSALVPVWDG